jgi:hypothetical protein
MVRRVYAETANSYSPFRQAQLQGLGLSSGPARTINPRTGWPTGRSYVGIAHFRAPYDEFSYFQDNTLQGLGACPVMQSSYVQVKGLGALTASEVPQIDQNAPGAVKQFLLSGDPVSPLRGDVTLPFNQVHPYVYAALAVIAGATSYVSYKRWKKSNPHQGI